MSKLTKNSEIIAVRNLIKWRIINRYSYVMSHYRNQTNLHIPGDNDFFARFLGSVEYSLRQYQYPDAVRDATAAKIWHGSIL